ncbi:MAG: efflux RND transporter periplasmic adaptor subunit [Tannerella sp.]|jgi:RND family efflux transporter MFP subunit|nr:efflux RND transporter periplasmic adaptor subunit [Tannerella sp.]
MKKYIICLFVAVSLLAGGCRNEKNHEHATEEAHEHMEGDGHDHSGHDHDHEEKDGNETDGAHEDEIRFTVRQAEIAGLETRETVPGKFSRVIKTGGQVQSTQGDEITLAATSSGIVSFLNRSVADGAAVRAGEAIVAVSTKSLPDGDLSALARINYETEREAYQRAEALVKDDIISAKEFEQVRRRYETARTAYEAQAAHVTAQGVTVKSPVGGFITNRLVGQGEYVSVGQPLVTISQNKRLQLKAEVSGKYYRTLGDIRKAHFRTAYDDTLYKTEEMNGRLLSVGKSAGRSSFYVPVTFEFDNTGDILPGAFAEVYLLAESGDDVITVPLSAVTEEQGLYFVYLQLGEEIYRKQEVTLGQDDGERVHILSGLQAGDRVVVRGAYQVKLAAGAGAVPEGHSHSH